MRRYSVGHLVAHPGPEHEGPPVGELGVQLTLETEENVPLLAPVIREIAGRVVDHPDAHVAQLPRAPVRDAGVPRMLHGGKLAPVGRLERDVADLHGSSGDG